MSFIEVERSVRPGSWTMQGCTPIPTTKSTTSTRAAASCCWQTPCTTWRPPAWPLSHRGRPSKTEGGPFARFNINVSPDYANPFQREVLQARALGAVPLSPEEHSAMFPLLEDLERCPPGGRHSRLCDTGPLWLLGGAPQPGGGRLPPGPHRGAPPAAAGAESAGLPVQPLPGKPEPGQSGGPSSLCPKPPSFTTLSGTCTLPPWTSC